MGKLKQLTVLLIVIAALGLASCDSGSNTNSTNSTSNNTNGNNSNSDADMVKLAGTNMKALKSYHLDASGDTGGGNLTISADFDIAANNNRITMNANGMAIQTVQIGNNYYASTDGGQTFVQSNATDANPAAFVKIWDSFNPDGITKNAANFKDGNPVKASIDGTDCKHITASSSDLSLNSAGAATNGVNGAVELWISTDATPTVRQMKVTSAGQQPVNLTFKWSHLNENLDIKAPPVQTPVK